MTKTILLLTLISCSLGIIAQSKYYEKQLNLGNDIQEVFDIEIDADSTVTVVGQYTNWSDLYWKSFFLRANLHFDTICTQYYQNDEKDLATTVFTKNYQYVVPINKLMNAGTEFYINFSIVDDCGTVQHSNDILSPLGHTFYRAIVPTFDNGYLLGGDVFAPSSYIKPYLLKVDSLGNQQWEQAYTQVPKLGRVWDILPAADSSGYFVLTAYNYDEITFTLQPRITKISNNGDSILLDKVYNFETDYYYGIRLKYGIDGNIIMSGPRHPYSYSGFIAKLDGTTLDTIWVNRNKAGGCPNVIPLADGNYIVGDCDRNYINPSNQLHIQAVIYKLSADGEILWYRNYGGEGNDYCYDLSPSPDGGYIMAGRTDTLISNGTGGFYGNADIYLVKTNCMGLLTLPQAAFSYTYDTTSLVAHFQNLSQHTYPDSIDGGHYIWDFGDGNTLVQTTDSSASANFTHVYNKNEPHIVTLTAIVCNDTSVYSTQMVPIAVGLASPLPPPKEGEQKEVMRVYPNPATNQLHITSTIPATFVLYDLLGRTVRQVGLSNGTVQISVLGLPAGTYFYQIINPQKQILQHDKLIVLH